MEAYLPVYCFSHLRLNRARNLCRTSAPLIYFVYKLTGKILHSIAPLEKWQLKRFQINLQAFDKYVHSMEGMA